MGECLHFIVQKHDGYWSAKCLDFTLYAVGETSNEACEKLHSQIEEFLYDSLEGEDKEFAAQLLLRRAPWQDWAIFHFVSFIQSCWLIGGWLGKAIKFDIPQGPYRHA